MAVTRRRLLGAVTTGCLALAGCTSGGGDGGGDGGDGGDGAGGQGGDGTPTAGTDDSATTAGSAGEQTVVEMVNTSFKPVRVSVEPGTTVEWVNKDGFQHDVTAEQFHDSAADWSFSETLGGGASTTHTFANSGVYEYYCTIHGKGNMCGAVIVGDASLDASLPCESGGGGDGGGGDGGYGGGGY